MGMSGMAEVIGGALAIDPDAFRQLQSASGAGRLGVGVALLAGLSQGIGQAFILFVNRVRPLRFALSLLLEAVLFALGFLVWAGSTWLVARFWFGIDVPVQAVVRALGLAHAPQLFAFLGALPYLGVPLLTLLSLWTAVAFVVGMVAATGLGVWQAFGALVVGWLGMHALQRTAGQPVMNLAGWLLDRVAGVALVTDRPRLQALLQSGRQDRPIERQRDRRG